MKRALIVGGSMGGLLAGNILLRQGWDVQVVERSRKGLEARGAGITPQRALFEALELAGASIGDDARLTTHNRVAYDRQTGEIIVNIQDDQHTTSWGLIYNRLRDAFPSERFHTGRAVAGLRQDADSATVTFEDGSEQSADLVIGADGIRSTVRALTFPDVAPRYAGYIAWRGMLEEGEVPPQFAGDAFARFNFCFPEGEELVAYPVAGMDGSIEPGKRRFNVMWYRVVEPGAALRDMLTDSEGRYHDNGIPPALIRPELIEKVRTDAQTLLPPVFADIFQRVDGVFFQPIYDLKSEQIGSGRIALIGDAAFVARPHCGAGVTKAAGDAVALARALQAHDSVAAATQAYSVERVEAGSMAVDWAAKLGSYFQMDADGRRRADYLPDSPPVPIPFIVRNTGIELSQVKDANAA